MNTDDSSWLQHSNSFFFSSRRRHTRCSRDWSSDVCSSDLVNFLDNCWDYNGGESEIRMGNALRDGYRQKAFLMSKIDGRTKAAAASQINESLRRLQTDRIDLLQFHEVIRDTDPDRIFAEGGGMEAVLEEIGRAHV